MKILLLSAYDALSHQYWRKGLVKQFPEYDWTVLTLPPRYFSWRLRGNSLSWAFGERELLSADYDLVVCTSHIDRWGYVESVEEYRRLLQQSDVVLSTAIHDFQGIAVLEGVAAGCQPVVPERLAYPELFASRYSYPSFANNPEKVALALARHLKGLYEQKRNGCLDEGPNIRGLSWNALQSGYRHWLESTAVVKPAEQQEDFPPTVVPVAGH